MPVRKDKRPAPFGMSMNATFGFCGGAILLRAFPRALLGTWISSTALVTTHGVDYQNGQLASSFGFTGYHRILGETSPAIGGIMIESSGSVPKYSLPPWLFPLLGFQGTTPDWHTKPIRLRGHGCCGMAPHQYLFPPLEGNRTP